MKGSSPQLKLDQPASYCIQVQGRLGETWSDWFEGMDIHVEPVEGGTAITTLSGTIADQAALFGLLSRIRDLGLPLLLVERIEP